MSLNQWLFLSHDVVIFLRADDQDYLEPLVSAVVVKHVKTSFYLGLMVGTINGLGFLAFYKHDKPIMMQKIVAVWLVSASKLCAVCFHVVNGNSESA